MSKIISAIFDDTDSAEFAMISLKRSGVKVESYELAPIGGGVSDDDYSPLVFSFGSASGLSAGMPASGTMPMQPFGGILYSFNERAETDDRASDIHSASVRMRLTVSNEDLKSAESMIRSCHGYRLRTM